jgi:glycosyltransferase involved in cell wall biosynthesis
MKKKIVISGINMVDGGIHTILQNALSEIVKNPSFSSWEIIALVPKKELFLQKGITFIEFPKSKSSWILRLYYEYFYFKILSKKIQPDLWLSLHDITPNVYAKKRFVYWHHPTTLFKPTWFDWKFNPKVGLFSIFYDFLFKINAKRNSQIFVQQQWIKDTFQDRFGFSTIKVALPDFVEPIVAENAQEKDKFQFIFPSLPLSFKNHLYILKALNELDDETRNKIEIYFAWKKGENKLSNFLKNKSKGLPVKFISGMSRVDFISFFNNTDVLIFPSKVETWGLPISEAKAMGKSVFLANLPYAKESIGNYDKVSFFNLDNPKELAKMITEIVNNEHKYHGNAFNYKEEVVPNWNSLFNHIATH